MTWVIFIVAFIAGGVVYAVYQKIRHRAQPSLNQEYFKGLNFLLNEQPDQAIEAFIRALEVDGDTVELHLALGGLFRRKGEIDRATRIHQNLIARPNLSSEHQYQAIHGLALDYNAAGLFDRAENLFLELTTADDFRLQAINGLLAIYQKQKDWHSAIKVIDSLVSNQQQAYRQHISHYWCEIAELAINEKQYSDAKGALSSALKQNNESLRAKYLTGELYYRQHEYEAAIRQWQELDNDEPVLLELIITKLVDCYEKLGQNSALKEYLLAIKRLPISELAFHAWMQALRKTFSMDEMEVIFYDSLLEAGVNKPAAEELLLSSQDGQIPQQYSKGLMNLLLTEAKKRNIEYTCVECGFQVGVPSWHCPSCNEWDTFKA